VFNGGPKTSLKRFLDVDPGTDEKFEVLKGRFYSLQGAQSFIKFRTSYMDSYGLLGGGFKDFLLLPLFGEDSHFD